LVKLEPKLKTFGYVKYGLFVTLVADFFRVGGILQGVGKHVEGDDEEEEEAGGGEKVPEMSTEHIVDGFGKHGAPAHSIHHAKPEEGKDDLALDRSYKCYSALHEQDMKSVGRDVAVK